MRREKGFTLIELMIVVAIIGILAAIAIPRFAALIDKAREAGARGNLGALRSAIAIYYGDTKGFWPRALDTDTTRTVGTGDSLETLPPFVPKYLAKIPYATLKRNAANSRVNAVTVVNTSEDAEINSGFTNAGGWIYSSNSGDIRINSTEQDTTKLVDSNCSMRYSNYGHEEP